MTFKAHFDGKVLVPDEDVDMTIGQEFVVTPAAPERKRTRRKHVTAAQLIRSGFVGGWKHRKDIADSVDFAKRLRASSNRARFSL